MGLKKNVSLVSLFAGIAFYLTTLSPVGELEIPRPANPCGLGATTCFKCHDGRKALLPNDAAFHGDHSSVNYSCPSCHGGKPWMKAKGSSHRGLRPNPMEDKKESCEKCHPDGLPGKTDSYKTSGLSGTVHAAQALLSEDKGEYQ